ncbi:MAG: hypothetical protein PVF68_06265 [Acidobacteriota bacterium]|jgi:hypothetical protein
MSSSKGIVIAVLCCLAVAPTSAKEEFTPSAYLKLLRADVRLERMGILREALDLSEEQGKAFWPIFREYDLELQRLGDRRVGLVQTFVDSYGTFTDDQVSSFAKDWFGLHSDRLKLRKKYFDKVSKAVSPKVAAQFIQVENVVGMMIDLQIAAELPLLE